MTRAIKWDGVGPKDECLLRIVWKHDSSIEWLHVTFDSADYDWEEDGGYHGHPNQYVARSGDIRIRQRPLLRQMDWSREYVSEGDQFIITHYAALPAIVEVRRIENDVEEGAVVG